MGAAVPKVGETLRDRYELVRTLGEGGMAVVYEARQKDNGQRVAVKVLAPELSRQPELIARFDREARAVQRLRTRHVAHVRDIATTDAGIPFMVMDLLDGRDLAAELEARRQLPIAEAVDYILQTAAAMEEAHAAGIVHRDLKPANLFLVDEGNERVVKVLDFGISKVVGEVAKLTENDAVMGTVVYMPPEQVRSSTDVDRRADVWALGVILYELLAGRAPFEGPAHKIAIAVLTQEVPDIRTFAPALPASIAAPIARMLERDRTKRMQDMREVVVALSPFVPPNSLGARSTAHLAPAGPPSSQLRKLGSMTLPLQSSRQLSTKTSPLAFGPTGPAPVQRPVPPVAARAPVVAVVATAIIAVIVALVIGLWILRRSAAHPNGPPPKVAPTGSATHQ
jgi:serine/threonine protein kinase